MTYIEPIRFMQGVHEGPFIEGPYFFFSKGVLEIMSKFIEIEAIDLTKSTPPSRTTQGMHSSSSKLRSWSAMDHLHQANHRIHLLDKVFNIDAAIGALSIRPTVGPASLTYKVNVTLLYRTFSYTSRQNKVQQIPTTVKKEAICMLFILYYIVRG